MVDAAPLPPPSPALEWVTIQAADFWREQGVRIPPFIVTGNDPGENASAAVEFWEDTPEVQWAPYVEWAYSREEIALVALHEAVHLAQYEAFWVRGSEGSPAWAEAQAESLAQDHLCAFMWRTWRLTPAKSGCRSVRVWAYPKHVRNYRAYSAAATLSPWRSYAARQWRLNDLRSVSWMKA